MPIELSTKTIKNDFINKVKELSGQEFNKCMQCGMCTGSCPMAEQFDISPRRIIRMAQCGLEKNVVDHKTFWLCASCYNCSVNCPRGIDIASFMEALRLLTLRKNVDYVELSKLSEETIREMPQIALVSGFRKFTS